MATPNEPLLGQRYLMGGPVPGTGDLTVRLALDEWSGHRVLMTLVPVPAGLSPDQVQALRRRVGREVALATGVRHPHVARVLGMVDEPTGGMWVAGEARSGFRTLRTVQDAEGGVVPGRVARWGSDIAAGLAALHEAGLTHRNVRAELVTVSDDGSAGLAAVAAAPIGSGPDDQDDQDDLASDARRRADVRALVSMLTAFLPPRFDGEAAAVDGLRRILATAEADGTVSASTLCERLTTSVNAQPTSSGLEPAPGPDASGPRDESTARLERDPAGRTAAGPVAPGSAPPPVPTPTLQGGPHRGYAVPGTAAYGPGPHDRHMPPAGLGPHDTTMVTPRPSTRPRVGRFRAWIIATVVVAVAAVVATVATVAITRSGGLSDAASRQPTEARQTAPPAVATGLLADPATADPCSLLTPASFRRFGASTMLDEFGPYYTCSIDTDRAGGSVLTTVYLYAPGEVAAGGGGERIGEVAVTRSPAEGDSCARQITLPDGSAVQIRAVASGPPPADLCTMADAGTATAVSALNSRSVARRAPNPADPLIGLDMCSLADPAVGGRITGVDTARITPGFGRFSCSMGFDPAFRNAAYAVYTANRRLPLDGTRTTVGRHAGVVTSYPASDGYAPSCAISLVQRSFVGGSGAARVGLVEVKLYGSPGATGPQICDGARSLATAAETRLPAPR